MTTNENQKALFILKRAAFFYILVFFLSPLINVIGGDSISEVISNTLANPLKFALLTVFKFAIGLLIGCLGWK